MTLTFRSVFWSFFKT